MTRPRVDRDEGFTLVETPIATMILAILMMLTTPVLQAVTNATGTTGGIIAAEARARLAVQSLRVQVQSAAVVCLPTQLTASGFTLRILQVLSASQSSGTLTTTYRWDQWRLDTGAGVLYEESSSQQTTTSNNPIAWPRSNGSPLWLSVAGSVANQAVPPFATPPVPGGAGGVPQSVTVDLSLGGGRGTSTQTVEIRSTLAALDTSYVGSPPACAAASPAQ